MFSLKSSRIHSNYETRFLFIPVDRLFLRCRRFIGVVFSLSRTFSFIFVEKKLLILGRTILLVWYRLKQLFTSMSAVSVKTHHFRTANLRTGKALSTGLVHTKSSYVYISV